MLRATATGRNAAGTPRAVLVLSLVIAVAQAGLLASTAWDKADTIDEPAYLMGALAQWTKGDFTPNCHAPAIPRWGFGLGMRISDPGLFQEWRDGGAEGPSALYSRPYDQMRRNLFAARAFTIAVTAVAGFFLFLSAEALAPGAGLLAQILWAFSPTTLAHGSLATLDMWAAGGLAMALYFLLSVERRSSPLTFVMVGLSLGLAAGSKLTALPFAGIALVYAGFVLHRAGWSARRLLLPMILIVASAVAIVWASFGFTAGMVDLANLCGTGRGVGEGRFGPVPAPLWIEGWLLQVRRGQVGFYNYLFGETSRTGWPWFYAVVLALKVTVAAQALTALAILHRFRRGAGLSLREEVILLFYPILLLVAMSIGNTQAGVRYILPAFPFFLLWLGVEVRRLISSGVALAACAAILLGLSGVESLRIHPHHLMFFNAIAGGPEEGPRYLITSEDWGQDQRRLGVWQAENKVKRLFYSRYNPSPESWYIISRQAPCEPILSGKYALHAIEVHRPKRVEPGCFDWLTQEPPDERVGYSIYIYRVDDARLERLKKGIAGPAFWSAPGLPPWRDRVRSSPAPTPEEEP